MKKYKSKIIISLFIFSSLIGVVHAEDLKLNCNVLIEKAYSEGNVKRSSSAVSVEIYDNEDEKRIVIQPKILWLSTKRTARTVSIKDTSDSNAWRLQDVYFDPVDKVKITSQVEIDRNTGEIKYSSRVDSDDGFRVAVGEGTCQKISTERKF